MSSKSYGLSSSFSISHWIATLHHLGFLVSSLTSREAEIWLKVQILRLYISESFSLLNKTGSETMFCK